VDKESAHHKAFT